MVTCLCNRVGVERSKVQVQFRDVFYEAEVLIGKSGLPSVGNSFKNLLQVGMPAECKLKLNLEAPAHALHCNMQKIWAHFCKCVGILQSVGKLVGKRAGEKRNMKILKGVSGGLPPVWQSVHGMMPLHYCA